MKVTKQSPPSVNTYSIIDMSEEEAEALESILYTTEDDMPTDAVWQGLRDALPGSTSTFRVTHHDGESVYLLRVDPR